MAAAVDAKLLDAAVMPNAEGFFGDYGGAFLPPPLAGPSPPSPFQTNGSTSRVIINNIDKVPAISSI